MGRPLIFDEQNPPESPDKMLIMTADGKMRLSGSGIFESAKARMSAAAKKERIPIATEEIMI